MPVDYRKPGTICIALRRGSAGERDTLVFCYRVWFKVAFEKDFRDRLFSFRRSGGHDRSLWNERVGVRVCTHGHTDRVRLAIL